MTQQILSRTDSSSCIEQFGLYPNLRPRVNIDEVVDKMRQDIRIELVQRLGRQVDWRPFRI